MLINKNTFYTIAIIALWFSTACKEKTLLNTSTIPAVDNINTFFTDTNSILVHNISRDSFQTGGLNTKLDGFIQAYYPALGCINADPVFGSTVASLAFQVRPPKLLLKFPTDGTIITDSLILSVPFRTVYGDTTAPSPQTFNVYRLKDTLETSKRLYNNTSFNYDPTLLGSATIDFKQMDSVLVGNVTRTPQMRIALSSAFADSLRTLTDTLEYKNATTFNAWLRGLCIVPADTNSGKAIGYFFLPNVTMTYYFRNVRTTATDTSSFVFKFDEDVCAHANRITRNPAKADANMLPKYLNTGNPNGDSLLFVQGDFGSIIDVKFPYLHKFPNAIINKAELEFTVVDSGFPNLDTIYGNNKRLFPFKVDATDPNAETDAYNSNNFTGLADGYLRPHTSNGVTKKRYLVNLNSQIQKAIATQDSTLRFHIKGLNELLPGIGGQQGAYRSVVGGNNATVDRVKLNIIYTKLK